MNIKQRIASFIKDYQTNLIMILSIIIGLFLIVLIDGWQPYLTLNSEDFPNGETPPKYRHGQLTAEEKKWATTAWRFFEDNINPQTGLVNSVENVPITTMWDTASYLFALISAHKLEIIDNSTFHSKLNKILLTLAKLPLFHNRLPNKSYNTITLTMIDYGDPWKEKHVGWSALDIARLMVPLYYITWSFPEYSDLVKQIITRWDFSSLVSKGELTGASYTDDKLNITQEGRLGYEQYAAKSLMLYGLDIIKSSQYDSNLKFRKVEGIYIPTDIRDPKTHKAQNYIVSEPFILDGLEFGWDAYSKNLAYRVYRAQVERFKNTGIYTAVSEDNIDQAPHFVYNTVYAKGQEWHTITEHGISIPDAKSLSTKASIGWYVLYNDSYTAELIPQISKAIKPNKGWFAGIYEKNGKINAILTANTNAIILEALYFKQCGNFIQNAHKIKFHHE